MHYFKNFIAAAVLVTALFAGQALESAKIYIKDKDWNQAEKYLLEAIDHPKDKWEAAFHLADKIYPRKNNWSKVSEYFAIAETAKSNLKIRPTRNDKKVPIAQAIKASKGRSYVLIYNRAQGFLSLFSSAKSEEMKQKYLKEGIVAATSLRNFDSNQPGGFGLLAQFYTFSNDKNRALENIDSLVSLPDIIDEDKVSFYSFGATIASAFKEYDLASQYLEEGLKIDPRNVKIKIEIGVLYTQLDKPNQAISQFLSIVDDIEDEKLKGDTHYNLGVSYYNIGKMEDAIYHFEEAFILKPDDEEAVYGMARALEDAKFYRKARKYFRAGKELNPSDPRYQSGISRTQIAEDQQDAGNQ